MTGDPLRTGKWGEALAERFLTSRRMKILGRRVRIGDRDEIDLVARDGDALVFVEVKTRATESFGRPLSAVDRAKRRALSRAATRYLAALKFRPVNFRFDAVEVIGTEGCDAPLIRHIPDAFPLDSRYDLPF